jgi:hypothetical protein
MERSTKLTEGEGGDNVEARSRSEKRAKAATTWRPARGWRRSGTSFRCHSREDSIVAREDAAPHLAEVEGGGQAASGEGLCVPDLSCAMRSLARAFTSRIRRRRSRRWKVPLGPCRRIAPPTVRPWLLPGVAISPCGRWLPSPRDHWRTACGPSAEVDASLGLLGRRRSMAGTGKA